LFSKICINQNGETPYFWGTDFTVGSQIQYFLFNVQLLWSYDYSKWVIFYEKPHFTRENFKFWEHVKWGLKIIGPKYQKAHPYAKCGRTNRLAHVAVALI